MSKRKAVPSPAPTWPAMMTTVHALKEHVEVLTRGRGDMLDSAVTLRDLITLGMIRESDLAQIRLSLRND